MLAALVTCLTMPATLGAQDSPYPMVRVGERIRVSLTERVLPSPGARPGRLRQVEGTMLAIGADTIHLAVSSGESPAALPRILIHSVERSRGINRSDSAYDAALMGGGVGVLLMGLFDDPVNWFVWGGGYVIGAVVGAVRPYEQWEDAWIPE
jgi:hypothetical protein